MRSDPAGVAAVAVFSTASRQLVDQAMLLGSILPGSLLIFCYCFNVNI
jgi:hypothetical protein